jgi:hypothetical protein
VASHLDEGQLVEALDGGPAAEHARSCAACGERVGQLAEMLQAVRGADVPEPPAFYWASLRRQIGRRIEDEPAAARRFAPWAGLAAVAAAAGLAVVLLRAPGTTPRPAASAAPQVALPSWSALPDDDAHGALLGVLDPASPDLQAEACDDVTACVAGMSEEESQQLVGLLREEMGGQL